MANLSLFKNTDQKRIFEKHGGFKKSFMVTVNRKYSYIKTIQVSCIEFAYIKKGNYHRSL